MLYYDNYKLYIIFCILCITCSMFVDFIIFSGYCSVTLFVTVFWFFQSFDYHFVSMGFSLLCWLLRTFFHIIKNTFLVSTLRNFQDITYTTLRYFKSVFFITIYLLIYSMYHYFVFSIYVFIFDWNKHIPLKNNSVSGSSCGVGDSEATGTSPETWGS